MNAALAVGAAVGGLLLVEKVASARKAQAFDRAAFEDAKKIRDALCQFDPETDDPFGEKPEFCADEPPRGIFDSLGNTFGLVSYDELAPDRQAQVDKVIGNMERNSITDLVRSAIGVVLSPLGDVLMLTAAAAVGAYMVLR